VQLALGLSQVGEFAFVLLSFSQQIHILDARTTSLTTAVVALSMAFTPLVFLFNDRVLQPRLGPAAAPTRPADHVEERNPVIVAGFSGYGSMAGRFLRANGIGITVLDPDASRVDSLRQLGLRVYYGDASRHELLHAAGAEQAQVLIIALDSHAHIMATVAVAQRHFPHLRLLVRSLSRTDSYDLLATGVETVYRETVDNSLRLGVDALRLLGVRAYHAQRAARTFLRHDEQAVRELATLRHDKVAYLTTARQQIQDLEHLLRMDAASNYLQEVDEGWDNTTLRQEALARD